MSVSMWAIARRPRWIAALILALGIAAAFAALGQWQLERSFAVEEIAERQTETSRPLHEITEPQVPVTGVADGHLVTTAGTWVPDDTILLSGRLHNDELGHWVVGHLHTDRGGSLAVALGWAPDEDAAQDARARFTEAATAENVELSGRYIFGEAPHQTDFEAGELSTLAPSALVNLWGTVDEAGTYGGYLIVDDAPAGLQTIDAPPPPDDVEINWLNIFYAAEWVIFAGFAIYLWWRLVRDVWEVENAPAAATVAAPAQQPAR